MGTGKHGFTGKIERVHWVELTKLQVVAGTSASFSEQFVEEKLHHQKGRAEIEAVFTETNFRVAAADHILLFEHLNPEAALCKEHGSSQPAGPRPDNRNVPFAIAFGDTHVSTIGIAMANLAGLIFPTHNQLIYTQEMRTLLPLKKHGCFSRCRSALA
jgi:hypothetical protein